MKNIKMHNVEGSLDVRGLRGQEGVPSRFLKVAMDIELIAEGGDQESYVLCALKPPHTPLSGQLHSSFVPPLPTLQCLAPFIADSKS